MPIHLYRFHFAGSAPDGVEAAERKMEQSTVFMFCLPPRLSFGESSATGISNIWLLPAMFFFEDTLVLLSGVFKRNNTSSAIMSWISSTCESFQ